VATAGNKLPYKYSLQFIFLLDIAFNLVICIECATLQLIQGCAGG